MANFTVMHVPTGTFRTTWQPENWTTNLQEASTCVSRKNAEVKRTEPEDEARKFWKHRVQSLKRLEKMTDKEFLRIMPRGNVPISELVVEHKQRIQEAHDKHQAMIKFVSECKVIELEFSIVED